MNLESQVVNLELSRKLKDLGVSEPSIFGWVHHNYGDKKEWIIIRGTDDHKPFIWGQEESGCKLQSQKDKEISAYSASELLQLLPYRIITKEPEPFNSYRLYITGSVIVKNPECIELIRTHIVNYKCDTMDMHNIENGIGKYLTQNIWDENPANALAKMLIFLIENNLMEIPQ